MEKAIQNKVEHIIKTATKVFARHGYAGTRMDEIARKAKVNKATIYYNVGNKKKLYEAVLENIFGKELVKAEEKIQSAASPEEKLRMYIESFANAIDKTPEIPNIMMWEHASGGVSLPDILAEKIAAMMKHMADILESGEHQGIFKKASPLLMQLMIIPALMFYKTSTPIRDKHKDFPEEARNLSEKVSENFAKEMAEFLIGGLKKN